MKNLILILFFNCFIINQNIAQRTDTLVNDVVYKTETIQCETCKTKKIIVETQTIVIQTIYFEETTDTNCLKVLFKPAINSPLITVTEYSDTTGINCPVSQIKWVAAYSDECEKAPKGLYQIQLFASKQDDKKVKFDVIKEKDPCFTKYILNKIFNSYCEAQDYFKKHIKKYYPEAMIKLKGKSIRN